MSGRRIAPADATKGERRDFSVVPLAILLTALGFAVRLPGLGLPPLDFHATRQYRSAIIARAFDRESRPGIPAWSREAALDAAAGQGRLEPPIVERAAAVLYRIAGGEKLWLPRLASILYWLAGSLCLFALSRRLFSGPAALAALAVALFLPYGVNASRSFQPDPLMVGLICAGWLALVRQRERPGPARFLLAVLASAAAALVKPMALFFVVPAGAASAFARGGVRQAGRGRWFWGWLGLILLPASAFYALQYFGGSLRAQAESSTIFGLWAASSYWSGWLRMLSRVIGAGFLAVSAAGLLAVRSRPAASLVRSLWVGYALFGLVFNYHIHTHDYYSLALIPVAALTAAALVQAAFDRLGFASSPRWRAAAFGVLLVGVGIGVWRGLPRPEASDARNRTAAYERLGAALGHSLETIVLDGDYGFPVFYHGELSGRVWPLSIDFRKAGLLGRDDRIPESSFAARLAGAEYFVATNIVELNAQPGLAEHLRTRYPRVPFDDPPPAGAPSILVYDLRPSRLEPEREELNFGGLAGGTVATGPQTVLITGSSGAAWTARSSNPVFLVSPESGTGSGSIVISVRLPLVRSGGESESGTVSILRDDGVAVPPVRVGLAVFEPGKSAPPIGYLDAPPGDVDAATGPVFISGWALDDIEVRRILLLRDRAGGERGDGPVLVGEIPLIAGTRPDIEKAYAGVPFNGRAGWGAMLRPEAFPRGAGKLTFHVDVEDAEGHRVRLGTRSIRMGSRLHFPLLRR